LTDKSADCIIPEKIYPLSRPHSTSFIDLNGDCMADLFVTSASDNQKYHEIWIKKQSGYCLRFFNIVDKDTSQVSFTDIDRDGRIDFIYMENGKLKIQHNGLPIPEVGGPDCMKYTKEEEQKMFYYGKLDTTEMISETSLSLPEPYVSLISTEEFPATIRIGDYNMDGYPDLLFTVKDIKGKTQTLLCETDAQMINSLENCQKIWENAILGAFFDLDEDGYF